MDNETILIIEDEPTMLRGLADNFEFAGYGVKTAADGEEGLSAALRLKPDLIILDIMLPMLTAKGEEEDVVLGLNLGADDYVTKPFSIKELLARAEAFLRRQRTAEGRVFRFGDCELDTASHRLLRNDQEVPLTPKEFALLALFAKRPGRAFTRDEILRSVWGRDRFVTRRSVDRCVNTLRKRIEPDPRHPAFIQTIREIGYRFEL